MKIREVGVLVLKAQTAMVYHVTLMSNGTEAR